MSPVASIRIRGFRSARDLTIEPGPVTALVGEAGSGKSNLLVAIWKLLAPDAPRLEPADLTRGSRRRIELEAALENGSVVSLEATEGRGRQVRMGSPPPTVFLPAAHRADQLLPHGAAPNPAARRALAHNRSAPLAVLDLVQTW